MIKRPAAPSLYIRDGKLGDNRDLMRQRGSFIKMTPAEGRERKRERGRNKHRGSFSIREGGCGDVDKQAFR